MLEVIKFENGRYGIRNTFTGLILKKRGRIRMYRRSSRAQRFILKLDRRMQKYIAQSLSNK